MAVTDELSPVGGMAEGARGARCPCLTLGPGVRFVLHRPVIDRGCVVKA